MAEVNGNLIQIWLRVSGTSNAFKYLICTTDSNFNITSDANTKRTNCGIKTAIVDPTFEITGTAVQDPNPGATQLSYADLKAWIKAKTKLDFNYKNDADEAAGLDVGEGVQNYGSAFITSLGYQASAEDGFSTYDITLTGTGTLDNYDGSATS
jgi:hypothetical protein